MRPVNVTALVKRLRTRRLNDYSSGKTRKHQELNKRRYIKHEKVNKRRHINVSHHKHLNVNE